MRAGFLVMVGLVFLVILLSQGGFGERKAMDHTKCKESFLAYMLFNECTPREGSGGS